jgi:3-methyladenine DNA glycosylase AlkD
MRRPLLKVPQLKAADARRELARHADSARAASLVRYFKAQPGEYAAGDQFLGLTVPTTRRIAREFADLSLPETLKLLKSAVHEERLLALMILERRAVRGTDEQRRQVFDAYLRNLQYVNHWDLVDLSCRAIVGGYLLTRSRRLLYKLARSRNLWYRRVAIVSTFAFIREGQLDDTFALAKLLIKDREDLIHKAAGWALREAGKKDLAALNAFLDRHADHMPRTMLRYAIERHGPSERCRYLEMRAARSEPALQHA